MSLLCEERKGEREYHHLFQCDWECRPHTHVKMGRAEQMPQKLIDDYEAGIPTLDVRHRDRLVQPCRLEPSGD